MTEYVPSPEAVETMALAIGPSVNGVKMDPPPQLFLDLAALALVALMEATVTEPCATCHGRKVVDMPTPTRSMWGVQVTDNVAWVKPCPDCPSPRSLAVRECERALPLGVRIQEALRTLADPAIPDDHDHDNCGECWQCIAATVGLVGIARRELPPPSPTEREEPKR
jgi:hypothetical protein